jgi:hypothetical protein
VGRCCLVLQHHSTIPGGGACQYLSRGIFGILLRKFDHPEIELTRLDEHLETLFPIIAEWIGRIFERLFGVEESYLKEHLTLAQATEIVAAALEVNQLPVIRGNVRRALQTARMTATV